MPCPRYAVSNVLPQVRDKPEVAPESLRERGDAVVEYLPVFVQVGAEVGYLQRVETVITPAQREL